MPRDHSFIPQPWRDSDEPALEWLYATGSVGQALAYSELFWPDFTEHEDCVFLSFDIEKYQEWMTTLESDKVRVEAVMNHRHIVDMFQNAEVAVPHDLLIALGRILKECWSAKLRLDFPQRRFEVQFDETLSPAATDYEITFFQPR